MAVPTVEGTSLRGRAKRLGWITVVLTTLCVALLIAALVVASSSDSEAQLQQVLLPLNVELANPGGAVLTAAALLVTAVFFGLAALQTAAVMRVLAPGAARPATAAGRGPPGASADAGTLRGGPGQ